jgi:hypothetical protein
MSSAGNKVDKNTKKLDKFEEDYDPEKDNRKYVVYRNDIKYKNKNKIDVSRAIFYDDSIKLDYETYDTDDIEYRIKECAMEKHQVIDLSHMTSNAFTHLMSHNKFNDIKTHILFISAIESNIDTLPDLSSFTNLISIDLSGNNLSKLPRFPASLEELIIDRNRIETINLMPNIKRIMAKHNNLKNIAYVDSMESLIFSHNTNLAKLEVLPNLYYLEIMNTNILDVPMCRNLKYLDMNETRITRLPKLDNLHILSCIRSNLSDISAITSLYSLLMAESNIKYIHYMATLQHVSYKGSLNISRKYKVHHMVKNKSDIFEILLKSTLVPADIMK